MFVIVESNREQWLLSKDMALTYIDRSKLGQKFLVIQRKCKHNGYDNQDHHYHIMTFP